MTVNGQGTGRDRLLITGAGGFTGRYVQQLALQAGFQCIALLPPETDSATGSASGSAPDSASGSAPDSASGSAPDSASGSAPDSASGYAPDSATDSATAPVPSARTRVEDQAADGVLPGVEVVRVDLNNGDLLRQTLQRVQPDHVIHLAAVAFVGHGDVAEIYQTNVIGTINLMDALTDSCPNLKRIILASSGNIYGNVDVLPIAEDYPARPLNDYAVSKHAMECAVAVRRHKLSAVVVRPFNYSGVGQSEDFLLPKIVAAYRRRDSQLKLGNLHVARDFSDVRDVAGVYIRLLNVEGAGGVFNICSGRSITLLEIIDIMNRLAGYTMEIEVDPALVRPNEIVELYGSDSRLRSLIGTWRQHELDDTLQWMLTAPS